MLRHLKTLLVTIAFGFAAPVCANENAFEQSNLLAAIEAKDYILVETTFESIQQDYLLGEVGPDRLRNLFGIFGTNNPKIVRFTRSWLEKYPRSPFAHTAQAWIDFRVGWNMRGERSAKSSYPVALQTFTALHQRAWGHAQTALEIDPRLLPAPDAIIRLGMTTGWLMDSFQLLDDVMATDPNWGSLMRAVDTTFPNWGGSWNQAAALCEYYGPMIQEFSHDPELYCKLYAAGNIHRKFGDYLDIWVLRTLEANDIPELNYLRLERATSALATEEDAAFAYEYLTNLSRKGGAHFYYAEQFDQVVADKYGYEHQSEEHYRIEREWALNSLENDPYDLDLIAKLRKRRHSYQLIGENEYLETVVDGPSPEEETDYVRRLLYASPYNPSNWEKYAELRYPFSKPEGFFERDQYLSNANAYSNQGVYHLMTYASSYYVKLLMYRDYSKEKLGPEWSFVFDNLDKDKELICPMVRAYRLVEELCQDPSKSNGDVCKNRRSSMSLLDRDIDDARQRKICTNEFYAPLKKLHFSPVEIDFSAGQG